MQIGRKKQKRGEECITEARTTGNKSSQAAGSGDSGCFLGQASTTDPLALATGGNRSAARLVLPLWIAAVSLAVIAVVLIVASFSLVDAVQATQASVVQLQQQVAQLKSGLGGLFGG